MFNIQNLFRQLMLAVILCGASLAAHADVIPASFRVTINSAGVEGASFLDMNFGSFGGAAEATATVSNLSGGFGDVDSFLGDVGFQPGGVFTISNQGLNFLTHNITAGSSLSFDVAFSGAFLTEVGDFTSFFSAALLDADYMALGNPEGDVIFSIAQLSATGMAAVGFETFGNAEVSVNAVPEPSELLLMLTGLAMMGAMVRRRQR